ncbi:MAG: dTDP-4-dehydrorhamnose 3,5-epimerase family protein [Verrucomicrobiota bacterium]
MYEMFDFKFPISLSMTKLKLKVAGAFVMRNYVYSDERGFFSEEWGNEFGRLCNPFAIDNICHSFNEKAGTVRGIHFQESPDEQGKIVSCILGRVWDVVVDLRVGSPTFRKWDAIDMIGGQGMSVFVPRGCGHGYATMEDGVVMSYLCDRPFVPESASAVRWNDPTLGITWPVKDPILSLKDRAAPFLPV